MNLSIVVNLFLLCGTTISSSAESPEWQSLFNARDLRGWEIRCLEEDRNKEFWKVSNGTLLCDSMGRPDHDYVWLVSEAEFENFELRVEFQAYRESPGNSGVQIRSRYDQRLTAPRGVGWTDPRLTSTLLRLGEPG
ncbi:MAG: 3-keto-disaccharide hydrolase [bacterium]